MSANSPEKITFSAEAPHDLGALRLEPSHADMVAAAEIEKPLPDVVLSPNPDFSGRRAKYDDWPVDIQDTTGTTVGHVNLVQNRQSAYISGIDIDRRRERFGIATYITLGGLAHALGKEFKSDPQGLSTESNRVWESLVDKGIAEPVADAIDQHGFPKYAMTMGAPSKPER